MSRVTSSARLAGGHSGLCDVLGWVRSEVTAPLLPPPGRGSRSATSPGPPLAGRDPEVHAFHEETRVTFSELSDELMREYVDSGEPM